MKKLDVIWSVSQKQYDMLNKQHEELQKKKYFAQFRKLGLYLVTRF